MSLWLLILLLLVVVIGVTVVFFSRRRAKKGGTSKNWHNVLAAILWVISGIVVVWLLAVFYNANVERIQGGEVVMFWIATIGTVVGLIGYRVTRPKVSRTQPLKETAQAKPGPTPVQPAPPAIKKTVFVSYRRDDSADVTGRIYDHLSRRFGIDEVFKDVDSIPLGRDFREVIGDAVAKASVVIVVVGKNWLGREQGAAEARIHQQTDFVRTEVAAALQQNKPVIPVLVSSAKMPSESELPDDIEAFAYRNGVNVRPDPDFVHDVERLIKGIEKA